jgi:hypothetical protein
MISHVFSNTCLSNAVSPSLRRKLANLVSKEIISPHTKPVKSGGDQGAVQDDLDGRETSDTIDGIIQGRVWRIMQLSLYDPLAARRLRPPHNDSAQEGEAVTDIPNIPDNAPEPRDTLDRLQMVEDDFFSFLEDEFDDLFDYTPEEEEGEEEGDVDNGFEALFEDGKSEAFEDLLDSRLPDGSQDGFGGPCGMDGVDNDLIEMDNTAVKDWDDALEMDATSILDEMDFVADIDEDMQIENQNMLL